MPRLANACGTLRGSHTKPNPFGTWAPHNACCHQSLWYYQAISEAVTRQLPTSRTGVELARVANHRARVQRRFFEQVAPPPDANGALKIRAQELNPPFGWEEYEYTLLIPDEDLPLIRAALGGTDEDSVLRLLATQAEQIMPNVKTWLDTLGAHYEFWSRIEPGHG